MIKWLPSSTNCGPHAIFVCESTEPPDDAPTDPPKGGLARLLSEASVADTSPLKIRSRGSAASLASFEAALSPWQRNQLASSLESSAERKSKLRGRSVLRQGDVLNASSTRVEERPRELVSSNKEPNGRNAADNLSG